MPQPGDLVFRDGQWVVFDGNGNVPLQTLDPALAQALRGYTDVQYDSTGTPTRMKRADGQWLDAQDVLSGQAQQGFQGFGGGASGGRGATGDFGTQQSGGRTGGHAVDPTEGMAPAKPTPQQVYQQAYQQAKAAGASDDAADQYASGVMNDAVDSGQTGSGTTVPTQPTQPPGGSTGVTTGGTGGTTGSIGGTTGGGGDSGFNPDGSPKNPQKGMLWFTNGRRLTWNGNSWVEDSGNGQKPPGFYTNDQGGTTSVGGMGGQPSWWPAGASWPPMRWVTIPDATGIPQQREVVDYDTILAVRKQVQAEGNASDSAAAAADRLKLERDKLAWDQQQAADALKRQHEGALARPETFTDVNGNTYLRSSADAPWQLMRKTPDINEMMDRALVAGNFGAYLQLADARDDPSGQKRLQTALQYASSPADYLTVQAALRGELPIDQPQGFGRVGPQAGFVQQAANRYFNPPTFGDANLQGFAATLRGQQPTAPIPGSGMGQAPLGPGQSEGSTEGPNANMPFPGSDGGPGMQQARPVQMPGLGMGENPGVSKGPGALPTTIPTVGVPSPYPTTGDFGPGNPGRNFYVDPAAFGTPKTGSLPGFLPPAVRSIYQGQPVQQTLPYARLGGPAFATDQSYRNMLPSERQMFDQTLRLQGIDPTDYEAQRQANKPLAPRRTGALQGFATAV